MTSVQLRVSGMDCASCAVAVEGALQRIDGVQSVNVDVVGGNVRVGYEGSVALPELEAAVRSAGYRVLIDETDREAHDSTGSFWERRGRSVMTASSGVALGLALLGDAMGATRPVTLVLLAVATIAGGWFVVPRGLKAAMNRALDMNFLMSVAAAGAWVIGEEAEAAATLFLFAIAELLESYSMDRARRAIRSLMDLAPAEATVLRDGAERRVPVGTVRPGETVVVRPGEKVGVDGQVISGTSSINESPITGESMPVDKVPGAAVFAGTLNVQGSLQIRTTKAANDSTLARIMHAVEEAHASRAASQTFVERFARIYTPAVVAAAVLLAVLPPFLGFGGVEHWVYRALTMLVVACPCALVISTPVSMVSGLTGAARDGVLIKGGAHLETIGRITTLCFDKTGTLTEGRPAVTFVAPVEERDTNEILRLAAGIERHSEHPLASAVLAHAEALGIAPAEATEFEAVFGRGATALIGQERVFVGNERFLRERGADSGAASRELRDREAAGETAIVVFTARRILGVIAIADRVRPAAAHAIRALRDAGLRRIVMLTGDNAGTARSVARQAGIDDYRAQLLPEDKLRIVRELQQSGEVVGFIGDGVNDAPALAAADVGIAMGAAGTDAALETADLALMSDDLSKVGSAVALSRRTVRIVKQNIAASLAIKGVFLVLALGGWATLWMAVAADMGGSLLVVANGLRAARRVH